MEKNFFIYLDPFLGILNENKEKKFKIIEED